MWFITAVISVFHRKSRLVLVRHLVTSFLFVKINGNSEEISSAYKERKLKLKRNTNIFLDDITEKRRSERSSPSSW